MKEPSKYWGRYRTTTYDWYLKWIASIIILCAMSIRGLPELALLDLQLSITGVFLCCQKIGKVMVKQRKGVKKNISSIFYCW